MKIKSPLINPSGKGGKCIVKLEFTDLFLLQNIDCGYSLQSHRRGGCNMYQQSVVLSK